MARSPDLFISAARAAPPSGGAVDASFGGAEGAGGVLVGGAASARTTKDEHESTAQSAAATLEPEREGRSRLRRGTLGNRGVKAWAPSQIGWGIGLGAPRRGRGLRRRPGFAPARRTFGGRLVG